MSIHLQDPHPWQSARDEFEQVTLPDLERHGMAIGKDAQTGNLIAMGIINYYQMLRRSFDPMTLIMLQTSLDDWKATRGGAA